MRYHYMIYMLNERPDVGIKENLKEMSGFYIENLRFFLWQWLIFKENQTSKFLN